MPQSARKDPTSQRAQDKESKRARGALSCAECRRLKLKCDKTVPCSSCKRRGCSAICPNGSLITGQGTRFVLADTEKLHQKIAHMSDRIRQLEDALSILQSTVTHDPHPLLDRDLLKIKSSIELHAAIQDSEAGLHPHPEEEAEESYIDAFGTLAIRDDGAATFYGRSAGSESLLIGEASTPEPPSMKDTQMSPPSWPSHAPSFTQMAAAFPLSAVPAGMDFHYLVEQELPDWHEAYRLCSLYLETAPWFFGAVTERQVFEELLPLWYENNAKIHVTRSPPQPNGHTVEASSSARGGPHELALLFIIFCFGALTDMSLPPAPDNLQCDRFSDLTKVALSLEPLLERPPSVATVQTLALMGIYEGLKSGENSIEATWTLMGMATKLAQSVGLHRDCARWQLSPAEVQKRRALFWELFITDGWQSLATGRLATFSLPFVDCELPFDPDATMSDDGVPQPSFPYWKAKFGAECVAAVVQGTLTSRAPKYSIILELDRKVRDMELPKYAQGPPPEGAGLRQTMSHFMPTNYRELTLLYIHRCFFVHAIASNPGDPIKSQYAPSFLAGYRSACDLLASVREQFNRFPAQIARFWVLWTHAFSSAVMISSVVTHGSQSKVAPAALLELKAATELFELAASYGGRAVKFLPIVRRLQVKAQKVYFDTRNGVPPAVPNDIFKSQASGSDDDEMHIFSGKTHVLTTKNPPRTPTIRSPTMSTSASRASSDSPPQTFITDNPSFNGVHPSLVHELQGFDTHIRSQIEHAYNADSAGFTQTLMGRHEHPVAHQQRYDAEIQRQQEQDAYEQEQRRLQEEQYQLQLQAEQTRQAEQQRQADEERAADQKRQEMLRHAEQQQRQQLHYQYPDRSAQHQQHQQPYPPPTNGPQVQVPVPTNHAPRGVPVPAPEAIPPRPQHRPSLPNMRQQYASYDYSSTAPPPRHAHPPPPSHPHVHVPAPAPHAIVTSNHSHPSSNNPHPSSSSHHPPPPPPPHVQHQHSQHDMYAVPGDSYQKYARPESLSPTTPSSATSYYWPDQSTVTAVPDLRYAPPGQPPQPQPQQLYGMTHIQTQQPYTPEGAMRGIAAEDPRLQETWQSYMYKVGSPRHMFED